MAEKFVIPIHGEDHCPGGPDEIPCLGGPALFRASMEPSGGLLVGNDIEVQVNFTLWDNEDTSIFDPNEILSGTAIDRVNFKRPGVYTVTCYIWWEVQFDGRIEILALDPSNTSGNWPMGLEPNNSQTAAASEPGSQFVYPATYSVTKKYPLIGITEADVVGAVYGSVLMKVLQASGSSRDLQAAILEIFYWGDSRVPVAIS